MTVLFEPGQSTNSAVHDENEQRAVCQDLAKRRRQDMHHLSLSIAAENREKSFINEVRRKSLSLLSPAVMTIVFTVHASSAGPQDFHR